MRKITFLKSLLLLCALMAGVGSAWGQEEAADWSYTVVNGDVSKLNTTAKTFTVDETHVWCYENSKVGAGSPAVTIGSSNSNYAIKFGSSKSVYFNPVVLSTDAFSNKAVTKVSLYIKHNGKKAGSLTVKQGSVTIGTATTAETSDWTTVTCSEAMKGDGGDLEIKYEVEQALYINNIEVWYEDLGTGVATTTTIDATGITNTDIASGTAAGTMKATVKSGDTPIDGAVITWSSSDESVATISNTGVVTLVSAGTTTITASYAGVADTYKSSSATYELTVTNSAGTVYEKVTSSNQLVAGNEYILVATDQEVAMGAENSKKRAVVGVKITDNKVKIADEAVAVLTLGGNTDAWTFLASDNSQYLAYSGSSNELHTSTDATEDASKWKVTDDFQLESANVSGRKLMYNSGSSRFACYTGTQQKAVLFVKEGSATDTKTEPEISYATTTYNVSFDEAAFFVAPTLTNPHSLTVTYKSSNEELAVVDENTGVVVLDDKTEGSVTITATFAGNEDYYAGSASYTITIYDANKKGSFGNPYTVEEVLDASNAVGVYIKGFITGFYTSDGITTTGDTNLALAGTEGDTGKDNNIAVQLPSGDLRTAWNIDDHNFIGVEILVKGNIDSYFSKQGVKSPTEIIALSAPAKVTSAGWATWVAPFNVEVPAGVDAYYVSTVDTKSATLAEVLTIPADEPVILKGEGAHRFDVISAEDLITPAPDNQLKISNGSAKDDIYVLYNGDKGVGMYKWYGDALAKGRVYLPATAGAPEFIALGGETTGIDMVQGSSIKVQDSEIYNLAGQRVARPTKGLYIVNGKKVVIR